MSYGDVVASTEADIPNLFAAFFSSNMEPSDDWYDLETVKVETSAECSAREEVVSSWLAVNPVAL